MLVSFAMPYLACNHLRAAAVATVALLTLGSCEDINRGLEKGLEDSKNHVSVCEENDVPALRASGSLKVQAGGKKFQVKVDSKAKLELGPLVTRADQPIACGQRQLGSGTSFSLLLHRKGEPAMTLRVTAFDFRDMKNKKPGYTLLLSGNVIVPGEDKPRQFLISSGSVEYVGHKRDEIKLVFNQFNAKIAGPGEKFPMSISGRIEIDLKG
jgi:hypothetical protein